MTTTIVLRKVDGRTYIEVGKGDCYICWGKGITHPIVDCPACHGTGRGARGGVNGCKNCHGSKTVVDFGTNLTCPECHGINPRHHTQKGKTEHLPQNFQAMLMQILPIAVTLEARPFNWVESLLGVGAIQTCVDYGTYRSRPIDAPVDELRHPAPFSITQVCNFAKESGMPNLYELCGWLLLTGTENGYKIQAGWGNIPDGLQVFPPTAQPAFDVSELAVEVANG